MAGPVYPYKSTPRRQRDIPIVGSVTSSWGGWHRVVVATPKSILGTLIVHDDDLGVRGEWDDIYTRPPTNGAA